MLGFSPTPSSTKSDILVIQGLAVLLLPVGLLIVWRAHRALLRLKKYEFEHRTDGGVVQFETFEGSRKHKRKEARAGCAAVLGVLLILIAVFMLAMF